MDCPQLAACAASAHARTSSNASPAANLGAYLASIATRLTKHSPVPGAVSLLVAFLPLPRSLEDLEAFADGAAGAAKRGSDVAVAPEEARVEVCVASLRRRLQGAAQQLAQQGCRLLLVDTAALSSPCTPCYEALQEALTLRDTVPGWRAQVVPLPVLALDDGLTPSVDLLRSAALGSLDPLRLPKPLDGALRLAGRGSSIWLQFLGSSRALGALPLSQDFRLEARRAVVGSALALHVGRRERLPLLGYLLPRRSGSQPLHRDNLSSTALFAALAGTLAASGASLVAQDAGAERPALLLEPLGPGAAALALYQLPAHLEPSLLEADLRAGSTEQEQVDDLLGAAYLDPTLLGSMTADHGMPQQSQQEEPRGEDPAAAKEVSGLHHRSSPQPESSLGWIQCLPLPFAL